MAITLHASLDECVVRKLGTPGNRELAMGNFASLELSDKTGLLIDDDIAPSSNIRAAITLITTDHGRLLVRKPKRVSGFSGYNPLSDNGVSPTRIELVLAV